MISQTGVVVGRRDDALHIDSTLPAKLSCAWRTDVDCSARLLHRLNPLSDKSAAVIAANKAAGYSAKCYEE
jgi:hypothetical protein